MGSCFNVSIMFPNVSVTIPVVCVSITIDKAFVFILLQPLMVKNFTER